MTRDGGAGSPRNRRSAIAPVSLAAGPVESRDRPADHARLASCVQSKGRIAAAPGHSTITTRLRLPLPPAPRTHAGEAEAEAKEGQCRRLRNRYRRVSAFTAVKPRGDLAAGAAARIVELNLDVEQILGEQRVRDELELPRARGVGRVGHVRGLCTERTGVIPTAPVRSAEIR